ncbi:hypothetical protein RhiirC2_710697 [Rhizophagus irregularis]|uniref:Uncharacterized protein n=1 Tax=Rhizophagus irregularis TaxID=588596 RepID=A0A2N1NDU9_9GLOM|nr:hypothetical protein RhiirC2_710697 [Rhizophagus irregularis]
MTCYKVKTEVDQVDHVSEEQAEKVLTKIEYSHNDLQASWYFVLWYERIKNNLTNSLDIWKVDIPGDTANIKLKPLENRSHDINNEKIIIKEIGGEELSPFSDFGDIFTPLHVAPRIYVLQLKIKKF